MFDRFVAQQRSPNTKRAYANDLRRWAEYLGGREPTEELAVAWRDSIEAELAPNTALRIFNTVRSYYKWAEGENPFRRVKAPRKTAGWVPVVPSEDDLLAIFNVCTDDRDRAILALLNSGLRAQEVCDLRVDSLEYVEQYKAWIARVIGKGEKLRLVPLADEVADALMQYDWPKKGQLFPKLNPRKVYYIVAEKWGRIAQVKIHPHALRHSFATRLVRSDVDVFSLQRLLGHARADTTSVYVNLDLGDLVSAVNRGNAKPREERRLKAVV